MLRFSVVSDSLQPRGRSPSGSSVHGSLQARILERVAISPSRDLPDPGMKPTSLTSPALAGGYLATAPLGKPQHLAYQPLN